MDLFATYSIALGVLAIAYALYRVLRVAISKMTVPKTTSFLPYDRKLARRRARHPKGEYP
jgi:hypothetical protein